MENAPTRRARLTHEAAGNPMESPVYNPPLLTAPKVLIVEDVPYGPTAESLIADGYDCRVATSTSDALDLLSTPDKPDVVVLDLEGGWELLAVMRATFGAALSIIVVSATYDPLSGLGATCFVPKPYRRGSLIAAVARCER